MIMLDAIAQHFFFFVLYGFLGWAWESVFVSMWTEHHLMNRGFLNGPCCPIYGCGAMANILLLSAVESPVSLFLLSGFACCLIEYLTSWAMEAIFHARWWDYSGKLLNINGRVCLLGFLGFASFSVILVKVLHPIVVDLTSRIPQNILCIAAGLLFVLGVFDYIVTLTGFHGFNDSLRAMSMAMEKTSMDWSVRVHLAPRLEAMNEAYRDVVSRFTSQQRRMVRAFPRLRSQHYDHALRRLKVSLKTGTDGK